MSVTSSPGTVDGPTAFGPEVSSATEAREILHEQRRPIEDRADLAAAGEAGTEEAIANATARTLDLAYNNTLANYAIGFLITVIILFVVALVGNEFIGAINITDGDPMSDAVDTIESSTTSGMVLFGVGLLVLPGIALVVLVMRGFQQGGGGGGMGGRFR